MSKVPPSSLRIDVTLSLICPQTPVTLSTTQKIETATTATIIIATETTKASRVTDHGSTCTRRRLARRPGWADGDAGRCGRALGALGRLLRGVVLDRRDDGRGGRGPRGGAAVVGR